MELILCHIDNSFTEKGKASRNFRIQWFDHMYLIGYSQYVGNNIVSAAAAKSLQSCPTLCDPIDGSPPGSPSLGFSRQEHWVGCHFLLQCMKVKSESEVAPSCRTLRDPMDCSPPGSSVRGIFRARVLEWPSPNTVLPSPNIVSN